MTILSGTTTSTNDNIVADSGNDVINSGNGNDTVDGGGGSDTLRGGAGSDTLVYRLSDNQGTSDLYVGGSGIDTVRLVLTDEQNRLPEVQAQIAAYYAHLDGVKTNQQGEVSNGAASDFTFTFVIDGQTSTLTVSMMEKLEIEVIPPTNMAPVAVADTLSAAEDTLVTYTAAQLIGNDTDADLDALHIASVNAVVGGSVALNDDGTVTFTPSANFNGVASFTYTVSDGVATSAPATVTVNVAAVNDAPVASDDVLTSVTEDSSTSLITFAALTGNDNDGDPEVAQTRTITEVSNAVGGTVAIVGGQVEFTPAPNFNGMASFDYTVQDNGATNGISDPKTDTGSVSFLVTEVNDAPVAADDVLATVAEGSGSRTIAFAALTDNDSDGDPEVVQTLTITSVSNAVGGTVAIVGGQVEFTPFANFNGTASFDYTVQDDGTSNGVSDPKADIGSVTFTVTSVNDAPIALDDTSTSAGATSATKSDGTSGSGNDGSGNVLTNDSDDSGSLTVTAIRTGGTEGAGTVGTIGSALVGAHGTLTLNSNGNYTYVINGADTQVQALGHGDSITDTFNYTISDGSLTDTALLTVTIDGANSAPTLTDEVAILAAGSEDSAYIISVGDLVQGYADTEGDALSVSGLTANHGVVSDNGDGTFTITPTANYSGPVVLTYDVVDGHGGAVAANQSFDLAPVADAPTLTVTPIAEGDPNGAIPLTIDAALTDVDGSETLTVSIVGVPEGATLNHGFQTDGVWTLTAAELSGLTITPAEGSFADFTLTITAISEENGTELIASTQATIEVTVTNPHEGEIVDGYIVGATVFADANENGILDVGEAWTTSGANGHFSLIGGSGSLVMFGGSDVSTGLAFEGVLKAPEGSSVITPLTTLIAALVDGGASVSAATDQVAAAFGLDPDVELTTYDPVEAALASDPDALAIYAAGVQVQNTIVMAAALLDGAASTGLNEAAAAVVAALAETISTATGEVNLSNAAVTADLLQDSALEAGVADNANVIATVADAGIVIAASNDVVDQAVAGGGSVTDVLTDIAQTAVVAQEDASTALADAGVAGNAATAVTDFTGTNLTDQVDAAEVGVVGGTVFGTGGNDTPSLTALADAYDGLGGNDTIDGGDGNDYLFGGDGDDSLLGGNGNDQLFGGAGGDTFSGGSGADHIDGGSRNIGFGFNTVSYRYVAATGALNINLADGTATVTVGGDTSDTDTLLNIQSVLGTDLADTIVGGYNALDPAESFEGFAGNDTIDGGAGMTDEVSYNSNNSSQGVIVNLSNSDVSGVAAHTASDGRGGIDELSNIERIRGGSGNDYLIGDDQVNRLRGMAGNDTLDGGGGNDQADYRNSGGGVIVNLSGNSVTFNVGFGNDTVAGGLARDGTDSDLGTPGVQQGTDTLISIEDVQGSEFNDALVGNTGDNVLTGRAGNDTFVGGAGNDIFDGGENAPLTNDDFDTADYFNTGATSVSVNLGTGIATDGLGGTDTLINIESVRGTSGADTLIGGNPTNSTINTSETFNGRGGNDTIDGGSGSDRAAYFNAGSGVTVDLALGTALDGEGGTDTLISIERVIGSNSTSADFLYGSNNPADYTSVGTGEWFDGRAGADTMDGRGGFDRLDYGSANAAVAINLDTVSHTGLLGATSVTLAAGTARDAYTVSNVLTNSIDTFVNMESARGSNFNDLIWGSNNPTGIVEVFDGLNGDDTIDGGGGLDAVRFTNATAGMTASLAMGTSSGAGIGNDIFYNIEGLIGSNFFGDTLIGSNGAFEFFEGRGGDDTIDGGDGYDRADYRNSAIAIAADLTAGTVVDGWGGTDTLLNIEEIRGSHYNDSFLGGTADDTFLGREGNDTLIGNSGIDTASYSEATAAVNVNLATGIASDGEGGTDTLGTIENVIGSAYSDTITGDAGANYLQGGAGSDTLTGGGGADVLDGGTTPGLAAGSLVGDGDADYVSYVYAGSAVRVNLSSTAAYGIAANTGLVTGDVNDVDTISNVERIRGSAYNDILVGNEVNNVFSGRQGDDTIDGGEATTLLGDFDTVSYNIAEETSGVIANLGANAITGDIGFGEVTVLSGTARSVVGGTDTLINIEGVSGTQFNDWIVGSTTTDTETFHGRGGNDTIDGGDGTNSVTDPDRNDRASYQFATSGVVVNLTTGFATNDGDGGVDTLISINQVRGSAYADTITGRDNSGTGVLAERFEGMGGDDTIFGGAGVDYVHYDLSPSGVTVNLAGAGGVANTGSALDGFGYTDTFYDIEGVRGSIFDDTLRGYTPMLADPNVSQRFEGLGGNDTIDGGGGGSDRAEYTRSTAGVVVDLSLGTANDGLGGTDTLISIEQVTGSIFDDIIIGNTAANRLDGGTGNDSLSGGDGNDTLIGGAGIDTLTGGIGTDRADYFASTSGVTVNLGLSTSSITGLGGTASNDGLGGNDALSFIEQVTGSAFNDILTGDGLANRIDGGAGNDTLLGGDGNDTLIGGGGNDSIDGGAGNDLINVITANYVGSSIDGGLDTDTLALAGTANNDGVSVILAGGVITNLSGISVTGVELVTLDMGGSTSDELNYLGSAGNVTATLGGSATGFSGNILGVERLVGASGDDTLTGDSAANFIFGYHGNDSIDGGGGNDSIEGGAGDDTINGGAGTADIVVFSGNWADYVVTADGGGTLTVTNTSSNSDGIDTVTNAEVLRFADRDVNVFVGTAGNDFLNGSTVSDAFYGGDGDDSISGSDGNDTLLGGAGNDTLNGGADTDYIDGGTGVDTLNRSGGSSAQIVNFIAGTNGTDTILNIENVIGSAFDDTLIGNSGANLLDGGLGNDTLRGTDGDDTLLGGDGDDFLGGGDGADSMDGGAGIDTVGLGGSSTGGTIDLGVALNGFDTIVNVENVNGSAFNDTLLGNSVANVLDGRAGNDTLSGLDGNDQLFGREGDDTLIGGLGADVIDGGTTAGINPGSTGDIDQVDYQYAGSGIKVNLSGTDNATYDINAYTGLVTFDPADVDTITNVEWVRGSDFDDIIVGGGNVNFERFEGRRGNDIMLGGAALLSEAYYLSAPAGVIVNLGSTTYTSGAITVNAGHAREEYDAGATVYDDTLININAIRGSNFADVLIGSDGNNRFRSEGGSDTIDGGLGTDEADYRSSTSVQANLAMNIAIDSGGTDTLTSIENLRGSSGNDILTGNDVANRLRGENGNDTLIGGDGDDTLEGGAGNDFLDGGLGNDVLNGGENTSGLGDRDTVSYLYATSGVTVNLAEGWATTGAESDVLIDIENVIGSNFADTLIGGDPKNSIITESETFQGRGGNDTIDGGTGIDFASYENAAAAVHVDLSLAVNQAIDDGDGGVDNLISIDRVRGSAFADVITGSNNALGTSELFEGMAGNDTIDGGGGFDYVQYQSSNAGGVIVNLDTVYHTVGAMTVFAGTALDGFDSDPGTLGVQSFTDTLSNIEGVRGSNFADTFFGSNNAPGTTEAFQGVGGNDTIYGGGGFDRIEYGRSTSGVNVNLAAGITSNDGLGGTDTFFDVEAVRGSIFNDSLTGSANADTLDGREGNDFLVGGAGNDVLNGGENLAGVLGDGDMVSYLTEGGANGVTVNLATGVATDSFGNTDTLIDIENVRGTGFADLLIGGNPTNNRSSTEQFEGRGGNDTLDGGVGLDWALYTNAATAVHVDLAAGSAYNDGDGGVDTLISIERVRGSAYDDRLYGSDTAVNIGYSAGTNNERFQGGDGNDYIDGRGGMDFVHYDDSNSAVIVDLQEGTGRSEGDVDVLVNIEGIRGSAFSDFLYGSDNAIIMEEFEGLAGYDFIDGRGGLDMVTFGRSTSGVTVNLATGTASDGFGTTDTFVNIESARGSVYGDTLTGNAGANILDGAQGNDILVGAGGADTFDWNLYDQGTSAAPAVDTITDFDATMAADTDALDLRDILTGEHANAASLDAYLDFSLVGSDTVINVKSSGGAVDQQIVLQGVDLTAGGTINDSQIITNLLSANKLLVDL
jgi:VCBS repeat-containing protein